MAAMQLDENLMERVPDITPDYPYCLHQRDLTHLVVPWHRHEEVELGYLETGTAIISTTTAEYTIHQGDGYFVNTDILYSRRNAHPGQPAREFKHCFHPVFLSGHFRSLLETKYLNPILKNRQIQVHVIRRGRPTGDAILTNLLRLRELQEQPDVEFQTRNLLSETWLLLLEDIRSNFRTGTAVTESETRLRQMLTFLHSHYAEKLTAAQIAASASISQREALRCFQLSLRQSPMEYLTEYRLNAAKRLLLESPLPITEIAGQCGFSDAAYFSKIFRRFFGTAPAEYRAHRDIVEEPPLPPRNA